MVREVEQSGGYIINGGCKTPYIQTVQNRISDRKLLIIVVLSLAASIDEILEDRKCRICNSVKVEDEYHHVVDCSHFQNERNALISNLAEFTIINSLGSKDDFISIMKSALKFVNISSFVKLSVCTICCLIAFVAFL